MAPYACAMKATIVLLSLITNLPEVLYTYVCIYIYIFIYREIDTYTEMCIIIIYKLYVYNCIYHNHDNNNNNNCTYIVIVTQDTWGGRRIRGHDTGAVGAANLKRVTHICHRLPNGVGTNGVFAEGPHVSLHVAIRPISLLTLWISESLTQTCSFEGVEVPGP